MLDAGQEIVAVAVEMALQGETEAGHELAAVAGAGQTQAAGRSLLGTEAGCPLAVLEDMLDVRALITSFRIDAGEALGVETRIIVVLESGPLGLQHMLDAADLRVFRDLLARLQVVAGQLEVVIPKRVAVRVDFLLFLEGGGAGVLAESALAGIEDDL